MSLTCGLGFEFAGLAAPRAVLPEPSSLSSSLSNSSLHYFLDDGFDYHQHSRPSSAPAMELPSPPLRFSVSADHQDPRRAMHRESYPVMVPPPTTFSPLVSHPPSHPRTKLFPRTRAQNNAPPFENRDRRGLSPLDSQVSPRHPLTGTYLMQ